MQATNISTGLNMGPIGVQTTVVDAVDLMSAMLSQDNVTLSGYAPEDLQMAPWSHPSAVFIGAPDTPMAAVAGLAANRRRGGWAIGFGAILLGTVFFAGGMLYATLKLPQLSEGTVIWSIVDLDTRGVIVATRAGRVHVPIGGQLPNGETVLATHAARRTAMLTSGSLSMHGREAATLPATNK